MKYSLAFLLLLSAGFTAADNDKDKDSGSDSATTDRVALPPGLGGGHGDDTPFPSDTFPPTDTLAPTPETPTTASGSGDPHFKTWNGDKFDYHGECDLVLIDNPSFAGGKGMKLHIRTTRVKYFSYIEKVALQIGDEVLEFNNDVENFLINGAPVGPVVRKKRTKLSGYHVRRDKKAISVRLQEETEGNARIDFIKHKSGFPTIRVDAGNTEVFEGSLGLLGEWKTGRKLARDGVTEMEVDPEDAAEYALEWQVREDEPMLFSEARFPQFPNTCLPPAKIPARLGMAKARAEAEEACAHWGEDKDDCVFDVMATRDITIARDA